MGATARCARPSARSSGSSEHERADGRARPPAPRRSFSPPAERTTTILFRTPASLLPGAWDSPGPRPREGAPDGGARATLLCTCIYGFFYVCGGGKKKKKKKKKS